MKLGYNYDANKVSTCCEYCTEDGVVSPEIG